MKIVKASQVEFGDFQTPSSLARACCHALKKIGLSPRGIVEPTCGEGNFIEAALNVFPDCEKFLGAEINRDYANRAKLRFSAQTRVDIQVIDFFAEDWCAKLRNFPRPLLVIGNPPWVTNSALGKLGSTNVPRKRNFEALKGIDALTGKSNFDISEAILLQMAIALEGDSGALAVLCKTSTARKVLSRAWKDKLSVANTIIVPIDAAGSFGVSVDACLLVMQFVCNTRSAEAQILKSLDDLAIDRVLSWSEAGLLSDAVAYADVKHLAGKSEMRWRSGVKHDAVGVLELRSVNNQQLNAAGEYVSLEESCLYPLMKSSDVFRGRIATEKLILLPQKEVGGQPSDLRLTAPKAWRYLSERQDVFSARRSSIYKGRPLFSIFGIGTYTFAPWKIAISSLYKELKFQVIGPYQGKPVVFDDTVYFLAFRDEFAAKTTLDYLETSEVQKFFRSQMFLDAKRPVTADLLNRLKLTSDLEEASGSGMIQECLFA